jgi:hypothetical protein
MYARQQAAWGYVPNYAKVFCYRPEVMARWGQLLAEIKRPMELRTFELATFVAAHELRNTACALAHGKALREFFSDEQIVAIAAGKFDGVLDDAEAALVRFARQIAKDASGVTAGQVQALKSRPTDRRARAGETAGAEGAGRGELTAATKGRFHRPARLI